MSQNNKILKLKVTRGSLRQGYLRLNGQAGFFPAEAFGPSSAKAGIGRPLELDVDGLPELILTDLPLDRNTSRPRGIFRKRAWIKQFFEVNKVVEGDFVSIERVTDFRYRVRRASGVHIPAMNTIAHLRGMDLFSGPGGLTLGLKRAGFKTVCAVEMRREAIETFKKHTPDAEHYCQDIREVNLSRYHGAITLLYGGPPCQPFSTGGLRKGAGDSRDMIPAFLAAVETVQPKAVLMENVPGLVVASRIHYLESALESLKRLGYNTTWRVLNAAHYGVPQNRRRLFVVGMRGQTFWFPRPTHGPGTSVPVIPTSTILSIKKAIGEPPDCPVVYAKYPDLRPSPYAGQLYNGGGRPIDLTKPCHTILASAGGYKTHWVDTLNIAPKYHKHLMKGGKPWKGSVPGARRLTVEESALIQTFPKCFMFSGSRSAQYTQIGDAVPPLLGEQLGAAIARQLEGESPDESHYLPPVLYTGLLWNG